MFDWKSITVVAVWRADAQIVRRTQVRDSKVNVIRNSNIELLNTMSAVHVVVAGPVKYTYLKIIIGRKTARVYLYALKSCQWLSDIREVYELFSPFIIHSFSIVKKQNRLFYTTNRTKILLRDTRHEEKTIILIWRCVTLYCTVSKNKNAVNSINSYLRTHRTIVRHDFYAKRDSSSIIKEIIDY